MVPIRFASVPPGAKLLSCLVSLTGADLTDDWGNPSRLGTSLLSIGTATDRADIEVNRGALDPRNNTFTVAGHPAQKFTDQLSRPAIGIQDFDGYSVQLSGVGTYTTEVLIGMAESGTVTGTGVDPTTWPARAVG